jgi:1-acyl-sn-glycerol-3-phosphate acyltransferase
MRVQSSSPPCPALGWRAFLARLLGSVAFSFGMLLSGMIASLVMLSIPGSFARRYRVSQCWGRFTLWWLRMTCRIDYQLSGIEHIPNQPVIVMAKHQSTWETLFFHQYLPPVAWVLKRELLWLPFFGWAMALLRPIAINRRTGAAAVKQIIRQGVRHLQQGQWVVIFPEGTRVLPGVRQRYGMGGAVLAAHSGYPILPVALNAGEYWTRGRFLKQPGTVRVVFGPLIASKGRTPQVLNQQVETWIENEMARISATPGSALVEPVSSG